LHLSTFRANPAPSGFCISLLVLRSVNKFADAGKFRKN
jgi:hypothetical protein